VNYRQQELYFRGSRIFGILFGALLLGAGAMAMSPDMAMGLCFGITLLTLALAVSTYYTPDYLHLTVDATKAAKWTLKIRWRIIGAVLIIGFVLAPTSTGRFAVLGAAVAMLAVLLLARKLPTRYLAAFFWFTDLAIIVSLARFSGMSALLAAVAVAASAHLAIVGSASRVPWSAIVGITAVAAAWISGVPLGSWPQMSLLAIAIVATAFLVWRASAHHARSVSIALDELCAFSGHPPEKVRELWRDSNRILAENWKAAQLNEDDHAAVKEWYRQNSGLYLYAISGHNLEYKKILSNLRMLRMGRGACLDYGAGNGEVVLELAARGHRATYFDVDGETLRFARWRAQQRSLPIAFTTTKDELSPGLDTIFSFDVLEHVPDLPGELTFLSSLLAPGGTFLCDVPAGATKNHPMHLNHHLDVADFLRTKGLRDQRTLWQRLTSREKYIFRRS
jgi:SAM-dependent methyltransferase